jgi:DNA-binding beta-propeller fold protein YncE
VLDAKTGAFKRMWGAFGDVPVDGPQAPPPAPAAATATTPAPQAPPAPYTEPGPPQFGRPVHAVRVSDDGFVYVADRGNGRIQVFTLAGRYFRQVFLNPGGTPGSIAFSPDAQQQFLYAGDAANSRIVILDRKSLEILGEFVKSGALNPHHITTDSKGNIYTAELTRGTQKLVYKGMTAAAPK